MVVIVFFIVEVILYIIWYHFIREREEEVTIRKEGKPEGISEERKENIPESPKRKYTDIERQAYQRAYEMKLNPTRYERTFKSELCKFCTPKEQYIIWRNPEHTSYYIVDFLDSQNGYIFEVDGRHHHTMEGVLYDSRRTEFLNSLGYKVFRIDNEDVFKGYSIFFLRDIYENKV